MWEISRRFHISSCFACFPADHSDFSADDTDLNGAGAGVSSAVSAVSAWSAFPVHSTENPTPCREVNAVDLSLADSRFDTDSPLSEHLFALKSTALPCWPLGLQEQRK
jgi:hypothetical protein